MVIKRILLDLDDVCNSFTFHVLRFMGLPVGSFDYHLFPTEVGYDIVRAGNILAGEERFSDETFWNAIPRYVWETAPESLEFKWLLQRCIYLVGIENVGILTKPTECPESSAGKHHWVQRHFPREMHESFFIGAPKWWCANNHALLIDDSDKNCEAFRAAGGYALLAPRPWNSKHFHLAEGTDTLTYLRTRLDDAFLYPWKLHA